MAFKSRFFIPLFIFLFTACVPSWQEESKCLPPPGNFEKSDLVGIWVAGRLNDTDTLVFREDGTYKQIIRVEEPYISYESDWNPWDIDHMDNGIPYLVLDKMRLCVYLMDDDCDSAGPGIGAWWDFCAKSSIKIPVDQGILMVIGVPEQFEQPPRGIELVLPTQWTDAGAWTYELQEP